MSGPTPAGLPRQTNYQTALELAWDALGRRDGAALCQLGAKPDERGEGRWRLDVLADTFVVDIDTHEVTVEVAPRREATSPQTAWQILALHYLLAPVPVGEPDGLISFEEIPQARGYAAPYRGRVISRLCGTVGRTRESLLAAAESLGGREVEGGDLAVRLVVFPLVPITIVWYAGDEEFPPGANFLFEDRIERILVVEDIVVTSERLVSRLCGKSW